VFRLAMLSLVPALMLVGSVEASAQVNVTGGYVCQGNCAAPGRCARAYVDSWWPAKNHISFYNDVGSPAEGAYATPTRVAVPAWGLVGEVFPNQIVWHRPGVHRVYALWIRNPGCLF
jgi:hypothetical protein